MPNPNLTHIEFLLDRSGSMRKIRHATIEAFNSYIEDQKKVPGEVTFSLVQFDTTFDNTFSNIPLRAVQPLTPEAFNPFNGGTALRGAIGRATDELGERLARLPEEYRPGKILFVVLTDGEERDSHRTSWAAKYTTEVLNQKVRHQENTYKWNYVYLGAGENALEEAAGYGFCKNSTQSFSPTASSVRRAINNVSLGTKCYRLGDSEKVANFYGGVNDADAGVDDVGQKIASTSGFTGSLPKSLADHIEKTKLSTVGGGS